MKIDYKIQDKFDFALFLPVVMLIGIGLIAIFSSTQAQTAISLNFSKQLFFGVVSILVFLVIYFIPAQLLRAIVWPAFIGSIGLLVLVLVFGKTVYGAKSWFNIGGIGFQPSEFAKIGTIMFLAHWLSEGKKDINNITELLKTIAIGLIPIMLILMENDTGTAIVFVVVLLTIIFWKGINLFSLFVVLSPGIVAFLSLFGVYSFLLALISVLIILFLFKRDLFMSATVFVVNLSAGFVFEYAVKFLQPHQQKRIQSFIDPSSDPLNAGYNALQAKVAIGSGGLFGKGFLEGNQTQLKFIPEQWTDFIYCVIGEEFGFIGSVFVLSLYVIIFLRLLNIAVSSKNNFGGLVTIGILAVMFTHFGINVGMNIGLTPVIGLPLPLLSYGGSSLIVNMAMLGIAMNIYRNRKLHT